MTVCKSQWSGVSELREDGDKVLKMTEKVEKVVIHTPYPVRRNSALLALARAKELQDEGHQVTLAYCADTGGVCCANYVGNPLTCLICQEGIRRTAKNLGLEAVPLKPAADQEEPISLQQRQGLAEGVLSDLISKFRLLPEDIRKVGILQWIKRRYYCSSLKLLQATKQLIRELRPDRIETLNGRLACTKYCVLAAQEANLSFNTLERNLQQQPIIYYGHTPFDRSELQQRILTHPADFQLAEAFFQNWRSPKHNRFAGQQAQAFSPPNPLGFQKKITFFLSSQDEFASLGREWKSPFVDAQVIAAASQKYPHYFFCVRFHPNQADIGSDIISPFDNIAQQENVQVYYPEDPANTYDLIDWSDVVVTFGSTVTVEACWQGKATVMLGPSRYDQLDVAETPKTLEEFLELLGGEIAPKDRTNVARLAYYWVHDSDPFKYLDCSDGKVRPLGLRRAMPILTSMARYLEKLSCRLLKGLTSGNKLGPSR